jgi:diadenosine tetraphosphatase ApaH/serine/threonine PP2A family protein phosphatase
MFFLLRGNHEFAKTNCAYDFRADLQQNFGHAGVHLFEQANDCFNWLPLAALLDNEIFCVHGGISPKLIDLQQINEFKRPIESYDHVLICDMVWSDPSATVQDYAKSSRGNGRIFGIEAVRTFLKQTNLKMILRGDQCVADGVECFGDCFYTVFSSSNYEDIYENACGVVYVTPACEVQSFSLPMLNQSFSSSRRSFVDRRMIPPQAGLNGCSGREKSMIGLAKGSYMILQRSRSLLPRLSPRPEIE